LAEKEPVEVVTALLAKLEKNDQSEVVLGDINESPGDSKSNSKSNSKSGSKQDRKQSNQVRFHINLGSKIGIDPKGLGDFISKKTKLRNSQIKDITIRAAFSFFTVGDKYEDQVVSALSKATYSGKGIRLEKARDRDSKKRR
jgi:ATP-dependent RNA helicase DeaD